MATLAEGDAEKELERALEALAVDNTVAGLAHLEKALKLHDDPSWYSYLGYCIARERGQCRRGIDLCKASLTHEPANPYHYLNLGKIHLLCGSKSEAIRIFREGITHAKHPEIIRKLEEFGTRRAPIFKFLPRDNPLNKYLGIILARLGLR